MRGLRSLGLAAAGAAAVMATTPAAMAVSWHSRTNPVIAFDGGTARAKAYGNFFNYQHESAHSSSYQLDPRPGGNSIYVETLFMWYGPNGACGSDGAGNTFTCYWSDVSKQTDRTSAGNWVFKWRARVLVANASSARGRTKTCEDQSWSPDPCSAQATSTFNY